MQPAELHRDCVMSPCGKYRLSLTRRWNPGPAPVLLGINALNPSKADAEIDDPTVLKLVSFGRIWKFDGYVLTNLWPFRATHPADLFGFQGDIEGAGSPEYLIHCFRKFNITNVLCCSGTHSKKQYRQKIHQRTKQIYQALSAAGFTLLCLGINQGGTPRHPLYLAPTTKPRPYSPETVTISQLTPTSFHSHQQAGA